MEDTKIEEAAKMYAFGECSKKDIDQYDLDSLLFDAFCSGINWFKKNLWHESIEEPQEERKLIVEMTDGEFHSAYRVGEYYYISDINNECEVSVKAGSFYRWLYIEDLMKGGE